jgi:hypothetical protein
VKPNAHFWARSAQPWLNLGKGIGVYEMQPVGGWEEIIELTRKMEG